MGAKIDVVSCFVFDPDGRLLLLQRHRDDWGGGLWATPAGKPEALETPKAAILREVHEESGILLPEVTFLGTHHITMPHGSVQMASFEARLKILPDITLRADEHEAHKWFVLETLLEHPNIIWATPSILRDFGLMADFTADPTLVDGSKVRLLEG